ncbi:MULTISPECIES: MspA family porin [unclassified Gordonia (in: high G+C Gram-positive bacteria)]|uniref:MspA family porin n=1 Tax=unclassified Gordonia (in: high G+C Gram-positive bacteria) TaxID=2657482 RepID=UPI000990B7ED|nr:MULTISPECIES: MspA family porin [unclassified Gordonia (in: high G+C Gram-positive bacteria)]MBR7191011.1 MspA family porin [Gordonia sp. SCSIO 19800]
MKKNITRRVVAAAGLAGAVAMGLTSLGAGGATAGPLPGGTITKTLVDGTPVTVQLFDEFVSVQRPISNVPTTREGWLSGKVRVTVGGKAEGGSIKVGYDVGCQVHFGGGEAQVPGAEAGIDYSNPGNVTAGAGLTPIDDDDNLFGGGVSLGPGEVKRQWLISETSGSDTAYSDYNLSAYTFQGQKGGVVYSQEQFKVESCAGYASARAFIQVTVSTDAVKGVVALNGKPFSLG